MFSNSLLLDLVMEREKTNFLNSFLNLDRINNTNHNQSIHNGDVLFKVPYNTTAISTLLSGYTSFCTTPELVATADSREKVHAPTFLKDVSDKVLNIPANATFIDCINQIEVYRKLAGKNIYGVVLRATSDSSIVINPYHILTALSVLNNEYYLSELKYNILIYFYTDRSDLEDSSIGTKYGDKALAEKNIEMLMQTYSNRLADITTVTKITSDYSREPLRTVIDPNFTITHQTKIEENEHADYEHKIVTHQVLTNGILVPYYGTSLIGIPRDGDNSVGYHLSPMQSCNIQGYETLTSSVLDAPASYFSVCTGSYNNRTDTGLRTLTHANLGSPYNRCCINHGALLYVDTMIAKSINLYSLAGIIPPIDALDPFFCEYDPKALECETFDDYLAYIKPDALSLDIVSLMQAFEKLQTFKTSQLPTEPEAVDPSSNEVEPDSVHSILSRASIGQFIDFTTVGGLRRSGTIANITATTITLNRKYSIDKIAIINMLQ